MIWSGTDGFGWNVTAECEKAETAPGMYQVVSGGDYWELWAKNLVF